MNGVKRKKLEKEIIRKGEAMKKKENGKRSSTEEEENAKMNIVKIIVQVQKKIMLAFNFGRIDKSRETLPSG
jgi:hypothetical protein